MLELSQNSNFNNVLNYEKNPEFCAKQNALNHKKS